jgi:hypothetical protein
MPAIEIAMSTSFTRNIDPWHTILETTTMNPWLLSSTPIVVVKEGKATQLVYSALPYKPWGLTPKCIKCQGQVTAISTGKGTNLKNHEKLIFKCVQLNCREKAHITRPEFVQPVKDKFYFFYYPYPLTAEQRQALWV